MTIYKSRIKKHCPVCTELFSVFPYQERKGQGNYCSIKCYFKENRKNSNNTESTRECYLCKVVKPKNEFYKNKSKPEGITDECIDCRKKITRNKSIMARKKFIEDKYNRCENCNLYHSDISFLS